MKHWHINEQSIYTAFLEAVRVLGDLEQIAVSSSGQEFYDDFESQLYRQGWVLFRCGTQLSLQHKDGECLEAIQRKKVRLADGIQDAAMGAKLKGLIGYRAVAPVALATISEQRFALLDNEGKTILRMHRISSADQNWIALEPLRGYDKPYQKVASLLNDAGEVSEKSAIYQHLMAANGFVASEYTVKPALRFGQEETAVRAITNMSLQMLAVAEKNEHGMVSEPDDTEFLHDYRICLRKIKSVNRLLKSAFDASQADAIKSILAQLMEPTGRLRDLDVYLLEEDEFRQLVPAAIGSGLDKLFADSRAQLVSERKRLKQWLLSEEYEHAKAELVSLFSDIDVEAAGGDGGLPIKSLVDQKIVFHFNKVCKKGLRIHEGTPDEQVHDLRLECKKLRYLFDFFGEFYNRKTVSKLLKRLKRLQDTLGKFNDYSVQQEKMLHYLKASGGDPEVAASAGALIAVMAQKQLQCRQQVEYKFAEFLSDETRALVPALFETGGAK